MTTFEEHATEQHQRMKEMAATGTGPTEPPSRRGVAFGEGTARANAARLKFTDERRRLILGALQGGHVESMAASMAGVTLGTLNDWLRQGADDLDQGIESDYATFCEKARQSVAYAVQQSLKVVQDKIANPGPEQLRAATWFLEHRHGKDFNPKQQVEVTGDGGGPVVIQLTWPGARRESDPDSTPALEPGDDGDIVDAEIVDETTDDTSEVATDLVVEEHLPEPDAEAS